MPIGDDAEGCYAFRAGTRLVEAANRPAADLRAGSLRAQARVRRLVAGPEAVAEAANHASLCATHSLGGGVLQHRRERIAA